jgi:hypothetical protein
MDASLDSLFQSQVALMRMELLQIVGIRVEEASRPLREEVAWLKLLLTRVGDSLEPIKACTSDGLAPKQASFPLDSTIQKSSLVEEDHLYGSISPCCSPCPSPQPDVSPDSYSEGMDGFLAPMLQITPEIQELCE